MAETINTVIAVAFGLAAIYIALRLGIRLFEFWQRRAEVRTPALLVRDAIFWFCLLPFAAGVLLARIYDPLRDVLAGNPVWQFGTGMLIVVATVVFAWYEHTVVGHRSRPSHDPYEDLER